MVTDEEPPISVVVGQKRCAKGNHNSVNHDQAIDGDEAEHEIHIWTERERRKKMRNMFSNLHSLLPQLSAKADKSTIVDEAVNYIKTLENTLETLEKQKQQKLKATPPTAVQFSHNSTIITSTKSQSLEYSREACLADQGPSETFSSSLVSSTTLNLSPSFFQTWLSPNVVISTCGYDAHFNICTPKSSGLLTTIFYILEKHNLIVMSAQISSDQHRSMYMIHAQADASVTHFQEHALSVEEIFKLAAGEMNLWLLQC
ncbi:transcription factor bHLH95 [Rutidosis leptorrhynchoides]|uniref:transcription factor bHLH95 n=1 Tax=Rutidosis leptorrhynchoides TaxID=125765 RepID=UPI003A9916EA